MGCVTFLINILPSTLNVQNRSEVFQHHEQEPLHQISVLQGQLNGPKNLQFTNKLSSSVLGCNYQYLFDKPGLFLLVSTRPR